MNGVWVAIVRGNSPYSGIATQGKDVAEAVWRMGMTIEAHDMVVKEKQEQK